MDLVLGLEFLLAKHHSLQSNGAFHIGEMDRAQTPRATRNQKLQLVQTVLCLKKNKCNVKKQEFRAALRMRSLLK